jgi:hypothetical protein
LIFFEAIRRITDSKRAEAEGHFGSVSPN